MSTEIERPITDWLPLTKEEVAARGWTDLDVVIISGDAYVDHPSFGTAVIGRIMESEGLRVAIVAQPNWRDDLRDFKKFGAPKLFFGVTAGCMDTMVNHYTANKRRRSDDAYTPGGEAGFRPDYAATAYSLILKQLYPDVPVLIGGVEASLRRVTHYDYWSDKLMPTILETSGADMLVYGMGEQPLRQIIRLMKKGASFQSLRNIPQTAFITESLDKLPKVKDWKDVTIASHEVCLEDKKSYAANFKIVEQESNKVQARRILQGVGSRTLVVNPPYRTMTTIEMDQAFDLPYTRLPHPRYKKRGPIPAYEMIKFSVNTHRGCFGGCSFCTISAHQGKFIASRSEGSILKEVEEVVKMPDFKGYISDIGGPSANMYRMAGKIQEICDRCVSPSCIHPVICHNLDTSHQPMVDLLRKIDANPKIKRAFVGSGIRYDLLVKSYNKNGDASLDTYMEQVITRHVSGRLKVAPEHTSEQTLKIMRKPSFSHFHAFKKKFDAINAKHGLNQQLIPYFISGHPGCEEADMADLAAETKDMGFKLEQVQGFTPTPMTVAEVIYYTGLHPYTLEPVYTAKSKEERENQHKFFFWYKDENRNWIKQQLAKAKRPDLAKKLLEQPQEKQKPTDVKGRINKVKRELPAKIKAQRNEQRTSSKPSKPRRKG